MNTKIALSGFSIITALALTAGATFALFTDQASSNNNSFTSGNASLEIAEDTGSGPGTFSPSIAGVTFNNIFPGFDDRHLFWLKNTSTSPIDLNLTADLADLTGGPAELDDALLIKWICDTSGNGGFEAGDAESSEFSVAAWLSGGNASIGSLTPGEQMICSMNARVLDTATDDISGETLGFDVLYDATQAP